MNWKTSGIRQTASPPPPHRRRRTNGLCVRVCLQGWFSPGQVFVLDEYCARYGVRGCHRHLSYLKDLMDYSENNVLVDPTLLHYSYAFCASHVHGNRYGSSRT